MGPASNTWNMKSETRGTQTDMVTDRNIADCLMELKSSAEFQDLSYRLSRSCTGELILIVTRDSTVGLLGAPFDPVCVTITASGICYVNVLFTPTEVINLKPGNELNLRKFRTILWKLNGRAGYGFCPGFKENDFPNSLDIEEYGLEVLRQPFVRVHAIGCRVFLQLRRSTSRAGSHPLGLQLCSCCLKALTDIYVALKNEGGDLSLSVFAKFLPFHSSSLELEDELLPHVRQVDSLEDCKTRSAEGVSVIEDGAINGDQPGNSVANVCEMETDNSNSVTVSGTRKLKVRGCSVLLDRVSTGLKTAKNNNNHLVSSSTSISSHTMPDSMSVISSYPCESFSSVSGSPSAAGSSDCGRMVTSIETLSRRVLSARIKPFRTVAPHGRETTNSMLSEGPSSREGELMVADETSSKQSKEDMSTEDAGPPVLTPETLLSPDSSPQPLQIDEDAEPESVEGNGEPDAKRQCYRSVLCMEALPSEAGLQLHLQHQHQHSAAQLSNSTTSTAAAVPVTASLAGDVSSQPEDGEHLPARNKTCPICSNSFGNKDELERHLVVRHGARLHPCRYCGQKFALKKNLADHLQRHRGSKTLNCQECGQRFTKKKEFAAHVREHMGSLPYFCTICSKLFSRERVYEEHMERHRARRGVRAVLGGSEKTMQGIMSKAKRCLEEKALMVPCSSDTVATPSSAPSVSLALPSASAAAPASEAAALPSSNLLLLSAVSLAQAEYDRQPTTSPPSLPPNPPPPSQEGPAPGDVMDSNSAAAQLLRMSTGPGRGDSPTSGINGSASGVDGATHRLTATGMQQEEDEGIQQRLNSPFTVSETAPLALPDTTADPLPEVAEPAHDTSEHRIEPDEQLQYEVIQSADEVPSPARFEEAETKTSPSEPNSQCRGGMVNGQSQVGEQEKELADRELRLRQKEEELKERERAITKKNMVLFQQLLLAQLSQQPTKGDQLKGGKPSPQQAAAKFAAMMAQGGMGRGGLASRFPNPGKGPVFHDNVAGGPGSAEVRTRPQAGPSGQAVPSASRVESGSVSDARPGTLALRHAAPGRPTLPQGTGPRPFRPPLPPSAVSTPPQAALSTNLQPSKRTNSQQGAFFLQELMKLESKMPASAKSFLPCAVSKVHVSPVSPQASRVLQTVLKPAIQSSSSSSGAVGKTVGRSKLGRDMARGSIKSDPGDGVGKTRGKRGWSGGLVKEKLNSVVTMVPPQEMQRLLSLAKPNSPLTETSASGSATSSRSGSSLGLRLSSPVATNSTSSDQGSSLQGVAVTPTVTPVPSPLLSNQSPPTPATVTSAMTSHSSPASQTSPTLLPSPGSRPSPISHSPVAPHSSVASQPTPPTHMSPSSPVPDPSPTPTSSVHLLPPMPRLIPAEAFSSPAAGTLHSSRTGAAPSVSSQDKEMEEEEVGPIDLSSGRAAQLDKDSGGGSGQSGHVADEPPASVILRRVLLDTAAAAAAQERREEAMKQGKLTSPEMAASQGFMPPRGLNPQAAALQAQLQASLQSGQDPSQLVQCFLSAQKTAMAAGQRHVAPQTLTLPGSREVRLPLLAQPGLLPQAQPLPSGQIMLQNASPPQAPPSFPQRVSAGTSPMPILSEQALSGEPSARQELSSPNRGVAPPTGGFVLSPGMAARAVAACAGSSISSTVTSTLSPSGSQPPCHPLRPVTHLTSVRPPHAVSAPCPDVPNFLLPTPSHPAKGPMLRFKPGEDPLPSSRHPLGGYAWHRPATVDPFKQPTPSAESCSEPSAASSGADKSNLEKDLMEDQNLWQQQFLHTLREKRRQQREQQGNVSKATEMVGSKSAKPPTQRKRRQKKNNTNSDETDSVDGNATTSMVGGSPPTPMPTSTPRGPLSSHPTHMTTENTHTDTNSSHSASLSSRQRGQGKGRGKGRKKTAPVIPVVDVEECIEEEGVVLQDFHTEEEVKTEPLEAGVRCDGCGEVFYNESDILQHDCDVQS